MKFKKNTPLKRYNTFRIGGRAEYFFAARNEKELITCIKTAKEKKLPFFVLGGGSNVLFRDENYEGLIIKIQNSKFKILNSKITAGTGISLGQLVTAAAGKGLSGLEWAAGIPGTVGGAIFGNAGAFGKSMKNITKTVTVLEIKNHASPAGRQKSCLRRQAKIKILRSAQCEFGYRTSIFKRKKNLIILSAELKLREGKKKDIKQKIKEYLNYKKINQPLNFPSAGSVFKNPKGFSAAKLIENCGLKGKVVGGAKISEKHANFIINFKNAKSKDVKKLINLAKRVVKKKFKINLQEEIIIF